MLLSSLSILMGAVLVPNEYLWLYSTHIILVCLYLIASKRLFVFVFMLLSLISAYFSEFSPKKFSLPLSIGQRISFNPDTRILMFDSLSSLPAGEAHIRSRGHDNPKVRISFFNLQGNRETIDDISLVFSESAMENSMVGEITQITLPDKNGLWWQRQLYVERQQAQIGIRFSDAVVLAMQQRKHLRSDSSIRERLIAVLDRHLYPFSSWRFSKALLFGSNELWSERDTWMIRTLGLAHLFVVSGLHVGFVFALGCLLSRFFWWFVPKRLLMLGLARWHMDSIVVIPILMAYCYLTGWGEPVVRASLMLMVYLFARMLAIKVSAYGVITFALWLVLLIDPRAILQAGLWLSFSMVYFLIGFFQVSLHWSRLFTVQLMLSTASMVLVLGWQEAVSSAAILINLLLIPITAFIWFPWGILACVEVFISGSSYSYDLLDSLLRYLMSLIEFLAFTTPLFFFELFSSFIPKLLMLFLLVYWVFQTPLKRGVFSVCGIWLALFSVSSFSPVPEFKLSNQGGELVLTNGQEMLLSTQWVGRELKKLKINSYREGGYRKNMALSDQKGEVWTPEALLLDQVDWLLLQGEASKKMITVLQALQVNWLTLLPQESLNFYFHDGRVLLRHSSCIFSFFLFKSDTCKRVEKLESMLN